MKLRIGTRGSALARRQVELALEALAGADLEPEIVVVRTEGDERQDVSLDTIGGQGVFVKAIEQRLLSGDIDVAVHSLKDMPAQTPPELCIGAVLPRADARDALVSRYNARLHDLPEGARIGSDSRRRAAQLLALRPDLRIEGIRGNVDTRLRKVDEGEYDAVVLALAGLSRMGQEIRASQVFEAHEITPAPGQGAIALECRAGDRNTLDLLRAVDDRATRAATDAERAFLACLGAGCQLPVGAHAAVSGETLRMTAVIADATGKLHRGDVSGTPATARYAGEGLARRLMLEASL